MSKFWTTEKCLRGLRLSLTNLLVNNLIAILSGESCPLHISQCLFYANF